MSIFLLQTDPLPLLLEVAKYVILPVISAAGGLIAGRKMITSQIKTQDSTSDKLAAETLVIVQKELQNTKRDVAEMEEREELLKDENSVLREIKRKHRTLCNANRAFLRNINPSMTGLTDKVRRVILELKDITENETDCPNETK